MKKIVLSESVDKALTSVIDSALRHGGVNAYQQVQLILQAVVEDLSDKSA